VVVNEIPANLNSLSLEKLEQQRQQRLEEIRKQTEAQYSEKHLFNLHTSSTSGRNLDDIRQEVELQQNLELKFNSSYVNEPPDFNAIPAKVRLNAATILREDSLYRKQQAKDVQLLKQYELELRDASEYYTWQETMREHDQREKLALVNLRREQSKLSASDAREAMLKQKDDNRTIASLLREQKEEIKLQKHLEEEIALLVNQETVIQIMETREVKPKEAKEKVLLRNQERSQQIKEENLKKLQEKEANDALEVELRADRIRQLKALNSVQPEHIKVFDPTVTAGIGVLDEMSYMEMKERLEIEKNLRQVRVENKRDEIGEEKERRAAMLAAKSQSIIQARERKMLATQLFHRQEEERKRREREEKFVHEMKSAVVLHEELEERREKKRVEQELLRKETERIQRQQQYLGQAMGRVDEVRAEEILKGQEREAKRQQNKMKTESKGKEEIQRSEENNRLKAVRDEKKSKRDALVEADVTALRERKRAVELLKEEYQKKKGMVKEGHLHHDKVKEIQRDNNRYADKITTESIARARAGKGTNRARSS
jgi:hypothetical protein